MMRSSQLDYPRDGDSRGETGFGEYLVLHSYDYRKPDAQPDVPSASPATWAPGTRYCDQPMDWRTRLVGIGGTMAVIALVLGCALFTWHVVRPIVTPPSMTVVNLQSFEAPPEPVREVPDGPEQVQQEEQKPEVQEERPPLPEIQLPSISPLVLPAAPSVEQSAAAEPVAETTAPRTIAAPVGRHVSSETQATWEALLLAHLEKYRRYPARARAARQEGVVLVRFRMNRAGAVLSSSVARSSGVSVLDQAALDTLRRAQPLPAIPDDRPDELELTLPVEFFVRR